MPETTAAFRDALLEARETLLEVQPNPPTVSDVQLHLMLTRYRATIDGRLHYAKLESGTDHLRKAAELVIAAQDALNHGQHADARQLVGLIQGILYTLGVHRWDYIASDDER
jgi:hypothetical protein